MRGSEAGAPFPPGSDAAYLNHFVTSLFSSPDWRT